MAKNNRKVSVTGCVVVGTLFGVFAIGLFRISIEPREIRDERERAKVSVRMSNGQLAGPGDAYVEETYTNGLITGVKNKVASQPEKYDPVIEKIVAAVCFCVTLVYFTIALFCSRARSQAGREGNSKVISAGNQMGAAADSSTPSLFDLQDPKYSN